MDPRQRRFLVSLVLMAVVLAGIMQFVVKPIREQPAKQRQAQQQERTRQSAARREHTLERQQAILDARGKWRDEVVEAGATGPAGRVPPLVKLRRNDAAEYMVTNITSQPICVTIWRLALPQRCEIGRRGRCTVLQPGQELEFTSPPGNGVCRSKTLEFRIGRQTTTDLPWWSDTALDDFDRVTALLEAEFERARQGAGHGPTDVFSTDQLLEEIRAAEGYLEVEGIVEQWKSVIDPMKQVQLDSMLGEHGEAELGVPVN
jgi:hypothetical protein